MKAAILKGINGDYLFKTMMDMKWNKRPAETMSGVLLKMERQDILDIAGYLSNEKEEECK